jgi:hypothetical protein
LAAAISAGKLPVPVREAPSMAMSIARQAPVAAVFPGAPALAAAALERLPAAARVPAVDRPTLATTIAAQAATPMGLPQRVTFGLSRKAPVAPISTVADMATGVAFIPPAAAPISAVSGAVPRATVIAPRPLAATAAPRLQGVDLRLDKFDLSETKHAGHDSRAKSLDECFNMGAAFWTCLEDDSLQLDGEDRELMKQLFNPELSDRRHEGDLFAPPDASYSTVTRLRGLLKEEEKVRQRRKEHFFSKAFDMATPGNIFPASWLPSIEIGRENTLPESRRGTLVARPEYTGEAGGLLQQVLKSTVPIFDRITEEGLRFIIYQLGSLEVRTTQDANGEETIGAVFSIAPLQTPSSKLEDKQFQPEDKVVKATEYVERVSIDIRKGSSVNYYAVFETDKGQKIVIECHSDGTLSCEVDRGGLDDRNSLAKVTRSADATVSATMAELIAHHSQEGKLSASARKRCVRAVFDRAIQSNK